MQALLRLFFPNQHVRVKVLFTLYIDKLLNRLRQSKVGCYVGDIFMGVFAYADDVALLALTVMELNEFINVCVSFCSRISCTI